LNLLLRWKAQCGDIILPRGEYSVHVSRDACQINLSGGGNDFKLPAHKRPTRARIKHVKLQFQPSLGAATWVLSVSTPPNVEFFCLLKMLNIEDEKEKEKEKERLRLLMKGRISGG
jgi:hypothetical protein